MGIKGGKVWHEDAKYSFYFLTGTVLKQSRTLYYSILRARCHFLSNLQLSRLSFGSAPNVKTGVVQPSRHMGALSRFQI